MRAILHTFCQCTRELELPHLSLTIEIPMERPYNVWAADRRLRFTQRRFAYRWQCPNGTGHFYEVAE